MTEKDFTKMKEQHSEEFDKIVRMLKVMVVAHDNPLIVLGAMFACFDSAMEKISEHSSGDEVEGLDSFVQTIGNTMMASAQKMMGNTKDLDMSLHTPETIIEAIAKGVNITKNEAMDFVHSKTGHFHNINDRQEFWVSGESVFSLIMHVMKSSPRRAEKK